jgi:F420-dependent oxidoreductase-like protein
MRIGIFGRDRSTAEDPFVRYLSAARRAADDGFATFWLPQSFGTDALTVLAIIGREVPGIELGTAVVPIYSRHPLTLASQTLTAQAAATPAGAPGRIALGIGLSHQVLVEGTFGGSFDKPVRALREYLSVLRPLLHGEAVDFRGEVLTVASQVSVAAAPPCPVLVAALGTQTLRVAGRLADGTITWVTGPETIERHTVPTIRAAAEEAGREAPRIVVGLPVCVTTDERGARERANHLFSVYGTLPSYRAMLDREGADGPGDVAVVGTADDVRAQLEQLAAIGATDFIASEFGANPDEQRETRAVLRSLL